MYITRLGSPHDPRPFSDATPPSGKVPPTQQFRCPSGLREFLPGGGGGCDLSHLNIYAEG